MMCRTRLMRRLPSRDRRWRRWSPEDASIGAVPFHEAKCDAVRNRPMFEMSPMSRAAPDGPIPLSSVSELPAAATSWRSCWVRGPDLGVDDGELFDKFAGELVAGLGHDAHRCRGTAQ